MKTLNKVIFVVMLATLTATVRYFKKETVSSVQEVVVGTSADFPPFSFIDQSGTIVGFDIDLIKEIFSRLNQSYRLENMPFETLLPQMQFGSIEVIAAGMSPTPERAARIIFSNNYMQADPLTIVTLKGSDITSFKDLTERNVAVNQGYVADIYLSQRPEIKLLKLPSISDAMLALKHHKVDAFVTGARTIKPLQQTMGVDTLHTIPIDEMQEVTALGISKRNPVLAEKINGALQQMQEDGSLTALQEKWHLT